MATVSLGELCAVYLAVRDELFARFPAEVLAYRRAHGLNQRKMASMLGITNVWLCNIEKGRDLRPTGRASIELIERFLLIAKKGR